MPIPRFMLFSSQHRSVGETLTLLFRCVPSNTTQSVRYTKFTRHGKTRHDVLPAESSSTSQDSRSWGTYVAPAVVLGFAGLAAFFHYNDERRAVPKGHLGSGRGVNVVNGPIIGGPFTLINTERQTITERNFLGNWVLLYFGYTSSPDLGPEQVQIMAKAIDILGLPLQCSSSAYCFTSFFSWVNLNIMYFIWVKNQNRILISYQYLLLLILNVILPHNFVHTLKVRLSRLENCHNFYFWNFWLWSLYVIPLPSPQ
ncbi:protein SCO1 homolog 2, mitochondrial isoform X2 [Abrus precatorius]|uniref:Protein SCO1 homolog 2, mitochondrial isoform X2 n=1 Tax=Abrus precatorius TaxID=3816 RepID=A0A8B8MED9_ABRPR|nr:protein SCO1 homolog 2, mitochondrial isoform X2 [Abrus precatorius]